MKYFHIFNQVNKFKSLQMQTLIQLLNIKQNLLPPEKYGLKSPYNLTVKYITIHNTAEDRPAQWEIQNIIDNEKQISFHFAVDNVDVVQGLPLNRNGFHAGDGKGSGNRESIGIEICFSKSGGPRYYEGEQQAILLTVYLMLKFKVPIENVK